jgi:hypothetical protein
MAHQTHLHFIDFVIVGSNLITKSQSITFHLVSMAIVEFVMLVLIKVFLQHHNTTQFEHTVLYSLQAKYVFYQLVLSNIMS